MSDLLESHEVDQTQGSGMPEGFRDMYIRSSPHSITVRSEAISIAEARAVSGRLTPEIQQVRVRRHARGDAHDEVVIGRCGHAGLHIKTDRADDAEP